jgi:hypothetical protein
MEPNRRKATMTKNSLDPTTPAAWADLPYEELFSLSRTEVAPAQLEALQLRFDALRPQVVALDKLATSQGVDRIGSLEEAVPVFFDHRVYKTYPLSLLEKHQFDRLAKWFQRLTTIDLSSVPVDGLTSVDAWLDRLDEYGMIIGHSTGTTGKLSFVPRSKVEWPAWKASYFDVYRAATGFDPRTEVVPFFTTMYRSGHQMATKMQHVMAEASLGGEESRTVLYDHALSADLLSLAGRLQAAEERGEFGAIQFDPKLLADRKAFIEHSRNRDADLEAWFMKLVNEHSGERVRVGGTAADLVRIVHMGRERGITCNFAPDSILFAGGGMKGYKDAPEDWVTYLTDFFGVDRVTSIYGMSEIIGNAPLCDHDYFHFLPYTIPIILDEDFAPLPCEGVQTGRIALFDVLAETYWGGFIAGDKVTMHWDEDCACGWKGPRIERAVARFSEAEGGDDKITCAGTAKAYSEFMDFVGNI